MADEITLKAKKREEFGRRVKQLRRDGEVPAVIHDHGKDSIHVSLAELDLKKAYGRAGKHAPVKLDVEGKKYTALIKELTYMPGKPKAQHSVFQAVSANEKVSAEVPVNITGEIPAERASLLVLKSLDAVEVEALPGDLVDVIEVSGEKLAEVGDRLHVSDLVAPANVTIKTEPEQTIAVVEMPKDQIAEADAALGEQAAAEGATEDSADDGAANEGDETKQADSESTDQKSEDE